MFETSLSRLAVSSLIATIPIVVWLFITFKKTPGSKKVMLLVFGLGCLTAPALLGLQIFWEKFPQFDLVQLIETKFQSPVVITIATLLLFAAMEEVIKLYVMRAVDQKTILISKINDAIRYSIAAALGFSFTENIYYLYSWWPFISTGELVGMFIFRSIFTTAAHMCYSGIFGYYYGIGKFSMVVNQQKNLTGGYDKIGTWIAKIFNLPPSEGFRQKLIMKGLFIAITMHFTVNYLLDLQKTLWVIGINILSFAYLQYLLNRKAGHLILLDDPSVKKTSTLGKKDEEVILELMAMWFKDKRYVDVLHICERLLERDPDNTVVQLFKAKAMDAMDEKNTYKKVLGSVLRNQNEMDSNDRNIISKYIGEKEMFEKVKQMIKAQLKKEGKWQEAGQQNKTETKEIETIIIKAPEKNVLEKYTGEGTFKIN